MDNERDPDLARFAAALRAQVQERMRSQPSENRLVSTRRQGAAPERPDNPLKEHERHQLANAADQEKRLAGVANPRHQKVAREEVDKYYANWERALKRAHARRYDDSPKIYERKIAERKIDPRLLTRRQKEEIHHEAVHEAVAQSNMRIKEINGAMPRMIDATIDTAVALTKDSDKSASSTSGPKRAYTPAKNPFQRQRGDDNDKDR